MYLCAVGAVLLDVTKVQATLFLVTCSIRCTTSSDLQEQSCPFHGVPEIADPVVYGSLIGLH